MKVQLFPVAVLKRNKAQKLQQNKLFKIKNCKCWWSTPTH